MTNKNHKHLEGPPAECAVCGADNCDEHSPCMTCQYLDERYIRMCENECMPNGFERYVLSKKYIRPTKEQ